MCVLPALDVVIEQTITRLRNISGDSHAVDRGSCTRKILGHTIAKHDASLSWYKNSIHLVDQAFVLWLPFHEIKLPPLRGVSRKKLETEVQHAVSATDLQDTILWPSMTVGIK